MPQCKAGLELRLNETNAWGGGALAACKRSWENLLTNAWGYSLDEVRHPVSRSIDLLLVSVLFLEREA